MRVLCAILLALLLLTAAQAQPRRELFVLGWTSDTPFQIAHVMVTGGALVQVVQAGDGLSGTIAAEAPRACLTITAEGQAAGGWAMRVVETWDAECERIYMPVFLRDSTLPSTE